MTKSGAEKTLHNLECIVKSREMRGIITDRVRIGAQLAAEFVRFGGLAMKLDNTEKMTIFGIPVEIDYSDVMLLEIISADRILVLDE